MPGLCHPISLSPPSQPASNMAEVLLVHGQFVFRCGEGLVVESWCHVRTELRPGICELVSSNVSALLRFLVPLWFLLVCFDMGN